MKAARSFVLISTLSALYVIPSITYAEGEQATKETVIQERDGSTTTVRTDSRGTQVESNGQNVYSAGGDRHQEQVDHSVRQGGKVESNK